MKKAAFSIPSIASKAASLFKLRKDASTMFNQPFDNVCPHYRIARILYAVFLTLLILISIPVITLKAKTYSFIEENRNTGFVFETTEKDGEQGISLIMAALPRVLYHAPAKLALITAVLSLFLGAAHLGFVGVDWRSGKRVLHFSLNLADQETNNPSDTNICLSSQHNVSSPHQRYPHPLRLGIHIRYSQIHITLSRWLRQLSCLTHERIFI